MTFKAKAKDSKFVLEDSSRKFVLEDSSRPRTKTRDNNTGIISRKQRGQSSVNKLTSHYVVGTSNKCPPTHSDIKVLE